MKRIASLIFILILANAPIVQSSQPFAIERVNTDSNGIEATGAFFNGYYPSISKDSRYLTFSSDAVNLIAGDNNSQDDVFIKDLQTGETRIISVATDGTQGNNTSGYGSESEITDDGRYVVFESNASNLVANDSNSTRDIFLRDIISETTTRISTDSSGNQANGLSGNPSITGDGRFAVFQSSASNLVAGDTNNRTDIFLKNLQTGETTRVSTTGNDEEANHNSAAASISDDGRFVIFESFATNLVDSDTNAGWDVFVKDLQTGSVEAVSTDSTGNLGDDYSQNSSITRSGRFVSFYSYSTNLHPLAGSGQSEIYLKDRQTNETKIVSLNYEGEQADEDSFLFFASHNISEDGRYVIFTSDAEDIVPGLTPSNEYQVFIHDTVTQKTALISRSINGTQGDLTSGLYGVAMSIDGKHAFFESMATNLIQGDTNTNDDIFMVANPLYEVLGSETDNETPVEDESGGLADTGSWQGLPVIIAAVLIIAGAVWIILPKLKKK